MMPSDVCPKCHRSYPYGDPRSFFGLPCWDCVEEGEFMLFITAREYHQHSDDYDGFCVVCQKFTREGGTEPDATRYPCPVCGQKTCYGTEESLLRGYISATEKE